MKKMLVLFFGMLLLAALFTTTFSEMIIPMTAGSAKMNMKPAMVYDATGVMQDAVVNAWEVSAESSRPHSPVLVYDGAAAMNDAVIYAWEVSETQSKPFPGYDATGAMLDAVVFPPSNR